jgi:UDP-N-acetylmuramoyl-tripeptide--D-alanyl-D-alanine ligase
VGTLTTQVRIAGRHNVRNAMAAATCALAAGAPLEAIARGLRTFEPVSGRSQLQVISLGSESVTLVNDSYNANPDSVRAAIDVLAELPGPRWLLLGDMGEVGDQGAAFHREVGAYARERGIDHLWAVGTLCEQAASAYGGGARHFASTAQALAALGQGPAGVRSVLVKGSRFMKMEQIVSALAVPGRGGMQGKDMPC